MKKEIRRQLAFIGAKISITALVRTKYMIIKELKIYIIIGNNLIYIINQICLEYVIEAAVPQHRYYRHQHTVVNNNEMLTNVSGIS